MYTSIIEARQALEEGQTTSEQLVKDVLEAATQWEPKVHAYLEIFEEDALAQARAWDKKTDEAKKRQPLGGIPIAIKDAICTTEGHTTAASKILESFQSPYDATVITKLKKAGAIIIGKANLDQFAMGASTEYSAFGVTKNPWDTTKVAGGSSGGSVVAVACREAFASLGTETGGSIRQPSSFCGTVGLKPTYGRVSRFGVIAYGSSLDQVGPITRTVKDNALMMEVLAGQDGRDATSSPEPVAKYTEACGKDIRGMKIGVPKEFFGEGVAKEVADTVLTAIKQLEKLGAAIIDVSLPLTPVAVATYYLLAKSEASTNLARYDGIRFGKNDEDVKSLIEQYIAVRGAGFGSEVKRAILMGTYTLSSGYYDAWYKQASKIRTLIIREYQEVFKQVDVMVGPVSPELPFDIGSKAGNPLAMYMADMLTCPINVANIPALAVPCGEVNGLPVGMQIMGPAWHEADLFRVGYAYEQSQEWYKRRVSPYYPSGHR
jgi:aspartyl-tRNA(Asn)/glutamyl-tRNA(Gln) amidotransferase subunit A